MQILLDTKHDTPRPVFCIRSPSDPMNPILSFHPDSTPYEILVLISPPAAFARLVKRINEARKNHSSQNDPITKNVRGELFFGLSWPAVLARIEELPLVRWFGAIHL